jgi:hypothetical protein
MLIIFLTGLFAWCAFFWYSLVAVIKEPTFTNLIVLGVAALFLLLILLDYSPADLCEVL